MLASCGNTQFEKYFPEKSLHDSICEVHLVPNNLNQVKKMDGFLKDALKEKNENDSLAIDKIPGKIQKRAFSLMGKEFSDYLTKAVKSKKNSKELSLKFAGSKKPFRSAPSFQQ